MKPDIVAILQAGNYRTVDVDEAVAEILRLRKLVDRKNHALDRIARAMPANVTMFRVKSTDRPLHQFARMEALANDETGY